MDWVGQFALVSSEFSTGDLATISAIGLAIPPAKRVEMKQKAWIVLKCILGSNGSNYLKKLSWIDLENLMKVSTRGNKSMLMSLMGAHFAIIDGKVDYIDIIRF